MKVYYFGCIGEAGHFLWSPEDRFRHTETYYHQPWGNRLDGCLCPDCGYQGLIAQNEGEAFLHHKDEWTAVAFWDRTGDERRNSNSAFIAEGTFTFDEMVTAAKAQWPKVWNRFTFEVVEATVP